MGSRVDTTSDNQNCDYLIMMLGIVVGWDFKP